jgi:hypothetical protein
MQAPARSENLHFNKPAFGYAERQQLRHLSIVGAGLLANAVYQLQMYRLTLRIREQARSHI